MYEGDTNRLSLVPEWCSPHDQQLFWMTTEADISSPYLHGLGGRKLRMATLPGVPFMMRRGNKTQVWYTGLCMDLLDILASRLNFTYVISEPGDQNWGQQLANGTWIGLTGMLHRKEADFAPSAMSLAADRAVVTDYTRGFYFDELVLIAKHPFRASVGWTFYTRPFHWPIFALLGFCLALSTFVLASVDWHLGRVFLGTMVYEGQRRQPRFTASLVKSVETLFGALIGRAVVYQSVSTSGNILLYAWLLLSMVIVASYTGKLTSNSVVTMQPVPFTAVSELVKRTDYRWGLDPDTSLDTFTATSSNKDLQLFHQKMLEFAEEDPDIRTSDLFTAATEKILTENYVRMAAKSSYLHLKKQFCELTLVRERLSQDTLVVYLQKNSPFNSLFDDVISKAWETGIIDRLTRTWFPENTDCCDDEIKAVPVSLDLLPTAFIMAAGGVGVAAILLVLERLLSSSVFVR